MPVRLAFAAAVIPFLLATRASATAQDGSDHQRADLKEYNELVTAFRGGDDAPARQLVVWPRKRVLSVVSAVPPHASELPRWDPGRFKAAAMLHTVVALRALETDDRDNDALFHLNVGSELLRKGGEDVRGFAAVWYIAAARLLLDRTRLESADILLQTARQRMPNDPAIEYLSGAFAEFLAGPSSFEALPTVQPGMRPANMVPVFERISQRRHWRLSDAARWLRAALTHDPNNAAIVLHLARVEMLREHDDEALRLLRDVGASASAGAELRYLAALFEGGLHERSGRIEDAVASYRRATSVVPSGQTAWVALSEALRRANRGDQSRQVLSEALGRPLRRIVEPWWSYFFEDPAVTSGRLNRLLTETRR